MLAPGKLLVVAVLNRLHRVKPLQLTSYVVVSLRDGVKFVVELQVLILDHFTVSLQTTKLCIEICFLLIKSVFFMQLVLDIKVNLSNADVQFCLDAFLLVDQPEQCLVSCLGGVKLVGQSGCRVALASQLCVSDLVLLVQLTVFFRSVGESEVGLCDLFADEFLVVTALQRVSQGHLRLRSSWPTARFRSPNLKPRPAWRQNAPVLT